MRRRMMKSKIHRATVTDANLDYVGSITIDRDLMERADLLEYEQVAVVDIDNGARLETYVIEGEPGSGEICLNGAAAHLVHRGDKVIIISYGDYDDADLATGTSRRSCTSTPPTGRSPKSSPAASRAIAPTPRSTRSPGRRRAHTVERGVVTLDLLVLGSGVAGLSAAVRAADTHGMRVGVLTKAELHQATTRWAQGGVAAVLGGGDPDSTDLHLADTLAAGAGLCDADAVRVLVDEGPTRVHELIALGAIFDVDEYGRLELAREGGHSKARVVHAGGAATGAEIERALVEAVRQHGGRDLRVVVRARPHRRGRSLPRRRRRSTTTGRESRCAPSNVLIATGGAGQLFAVTTNPAEATGDGIAMALRAGVAVADLEFVQFHPTALHHPAMPRPLLSEALRGHGALLRDAHGEQFVDELLPARQGVAGDDGDGCSSRASTISGSTPRGSSASTSASRRSPPRCATSGSIRRTTGCRSRRPRTTSAAASSPTSTARRRCPACGPRARRPATACTAPTAWRRTRCSTAWCSPRGSSKPSRRARTAAEPTGAMRAVLGDVEGGDAASPAGACRSSIELGRRRAGHAPGVCRPR